MPADPLQRLREALRVREDAGLRRWLRPRDASEPVLDLAGNDYLGLAHDKRVTEAAGAAALRWGAGSTGSRLVTGTTALHAEFEVELADFMQADAALVFSSGYLANLAVLSVLGGQSVLGGAGVTIVSDAGNHASIVDACRLSGASIRVVPHRDVAAFAAAIPEREPVVVTDAVFSVDGDLAPLRQLHNLVRAHNGLLVVDEAHALGVVGEGGTGAVVAAGLAGEPDVISTVTLSKSLGSQGGAVLGDRAVIDLLISTARPFIFDTALAPASVGAAQAALQILCAEPERSARVRANAAALAGLSARFSSEAIQPQAAVVPVFLGDPRRALAATQACLESGLRVGCFRPPSVPDGRSCLRLTARADLDEADLRFVAQVLGRVLQ